MRAPALLACVLLACDDVSEHAQATCALVDTSGSYVSEVAPAMQILKLALLPQSTPGDTLVAAFIDADSYEKQNVVAVMTLDARPSQANAQKLAFANALDGFSRKVMTARHTDISGGVLLCADYLREARAARKTIVIFSDMQEELPPGTRRELTGLGGIDVVALNVKRLRTDNADPARYRERLAVWDSTITAAHGKGFQWVQDAQRLAALMGR